MTEQPQINTTISPEVHLMATCMQLRLNQNNHRGNTLQEMPSDATYETMVAAIKRHVNYLETTTPPSRWSNQMITDCLDIANYATMLANLAWNGLRGGPFQPALPQPEESVTDEHIETTDDTGNGVDEPVGEQQADEPIF